MTTFNEGTFPDDPGCAAVQRRYAAAVANAAAAALEAKATGVEQRSIRESMPLTLQDVVDLIASKAPGSRVVWPGSTIVLHEALRLPGTVGITCSPVGIVVERLP